MNEKEKLTARQVQVLELIRKGFTTQGVADELGVSKSMVNFHLERAFRRLNVKNRLQALVAAGMLEGSQEPPK